MHKKNERAHETLQAEATATRVANAATHPRHVVLRVRSNAKAGRRDLAHYDWDWD